MKKEGCRDEVKEKEVIGEGEGEWMKGREG